MLGTREFMASPEEQLRELIAKELRLKEALDRTRYQSLPHDTVDFERISERARDRLKNAVFADRNQKESRMRALTNALQSVHARIEALRSQTYDMVVFIPATSEDSLAKLQGMPVVELPQRKRKKKFHPRNPMPGCNTRPLWEILEQRFEHSISLPYRCAGKSNVIVGGVDLVSERGIKGLGHFSVQVE